MLIIIGLLTGTIGTNNPINLFQQTHQQYTEPRELVESALFNNAGGRPFGHRKISRAASGRRSCRLCESNIQARAGVL